MCDLRTMTTIYRATNDKSDAEKIPTGSCWTESREVAQAYTDNQGFGGKHIVEAELVGAILDLTDGWDDLAELVDQDQWEPAELVQIWRDNGWLYPWEESRNVADAISAAGYVWVRYIDDFPAGAITLKKV
jgi:hypothetical protein